MMTCTHCGSLDSGDIGDGIACTGCGVMLKEHGGNEAMLDNAMLKLILDRFAPGVDAVGDGIYGLQWTSTTTFYRHTEEYVDVEQRLAYKLELERVFPGKKNVI